MTIEHFLVDKEHPLPADYIPKDLVLAPIPFAAQLDDPKCLISSAMYYPLKSLYFASRKMGLQLIGISAYRSYERQKEIYEHSIATRGYSYTEKYIAAPGTSEHQTGLAIDLSCPSNHYELTESFAKTPEGQWLTRYAPLYGFLFSYPEDSYEKTGYYYEPWHIRYACTNTGYYDIIDTMSKK